MLARGSAEQFLTRLNFQMNAKKQENYDCLLFAILPAIGLADVASRMNCGRKRN